MDQDTRLSLNSTDLEKKLLHMKNNSILTDVSLMCNNKTLTAHKCILANSSLFFKVIFTDKVDGKDLSHVTLAMDQIGVGTHHLERIIDFMYTGTITLNLDVVADVVLLADYLVMTDLSDLAHKYLGLVLNEENCLTLYLSLYNHDLHLDASKDIVASIWETLESVFFNFIIVQELFLQISVDHLSHLLSKGLRRNFNLQNVLKFLVNWIQQRNDDNMMEIVEQLINLCREMCKSKDVNHYRQLDLILQDLRWSAQHKLESGQTMEPDVLDNIVCSIHLLQTDVDTEGISNKAGEQNYPSDSVHSPAVEETEEEKFQLDSSEPAFTKIKLKTVDSKTLQQTPEDVNCKKGTKSLSSSLDKIKFKALEKSVQEHVMTFLQGQIVNPQNTKIKQERFTTDGPEADVDAHIPTESNYLNSVRAINRSLEEREHSNMKSVVNSITKRRKTKPSFRAGFDSWESNETDDLDEFVEDVEDIDEDIHDGIDDGDSTDLDTTGDLQNGQEKQSSNNDLIENNITLGHEVEVKENKRKRKMKISFETHKQREFTEILNAELMELLKMSKQENYTCFVCNSVFTRSYHFVRHLDRQHRDAVMICEKCGEAFKDPKLYVSHGRTHLTDVEEMLTEVLEHDGNKVYSCKICLKEITKVSSIRAHLVYHRTIYCKAEQNDLDDSKEDSSVVKNTKPFPPKTTIHQCTICSNTFKRRDHLSRHILCVHSDEFPFTCEVCGKQFKVRYRYSEHLQRHTENSLSGGNVEKDEKSILCYICGATVKSQKYLKKHLDTHLNRERRHTCTVCHKSYAQAMTLQVHMRKHTGDKPYQCEICSMLFAVKSNLLRHQRRHRGEKRYKCDQCGKGFLMVGDLKRHYTTHTGEKNYACRYCGKKFNCKSKVPQHERIHTGEKPYACLYCGKRFIQSGDRKRHEATHTGHKEDKTRRLTLYEMANFTDLSTQPDLIGENQETKYEQESNIVDVQWNRDEKMNVEHVPMNIPINFESENRILQN